MLIHQAVVTNIAVFRVSGAHRPHDAATLHARVEHALRRGFRDVILNLKGITHVGGAGMGELVSINGVVRAFNGRLILCALPGRIRYLLAVSGLSPFFETSDSESHAVAAAAARLDPDRDHESPILPSPNPATVRRRGSAYC